MGQPAYPGIARDCIVDKIEEFRGELTSPTTVPGERLLALKFILHLVGDIHQPLHAADDSDRGGNKKRISAEDKASGNLHAFWDTTVVRRLGARPEQVAGDLLGRITPEERARWSAGTPADWARESSEVARRDAYGRLPPPGTDGVYQLNENYESLATKDAVEQMEKAGVRLAWLLNSALDASEAK